MGFFARFRKVDAATRAANDERTKREAKQSVQNRRQSRVDLNHWESKYGRGPTGGAGSASSDERTVVAAAESVGMEKARSHGSISTSASYKPESIRGDGGEAGGVRASIDFLPRIELSYGEPLAMTPPTVTDIITSPPASPRPSTDGSRSDTGRRPPLAVLHDAEPASRSPLVPQRNSFSSERRVQIASPRPQRQSRAMSMQSLALPSNGKGLGTSPRLLDLMNESEMAGQVDDDDLPLAAVRSQSSPVLPKRSSMYSLSGGVGGGPGPSSSTPSLSMPTSRSRASLAMPAILLPPSPNPEALEQPRSLPRQDTQRSLASIGRTGTLIDLSAPSTYDPYHDRNRRAQAGSGPERIAVGERRKASPSNGTKTPPKAGGSTSAARIMEFGQLEERHKKRLSMLQGTANEKVEVEKALAQFQEKQRKEAETQRRREARRSSASNLDQFGAREAKDVRSSDTAKQRSRMSVSNLSVLLKRGGPESKPPSIRTPAASSTKAAMDDEDDDVPLHHLARSPSGTVSFPDARPHSRRSSTHAQPIPQRRTSMSPIGPTRPSLGARRHSLGTLLEVSHDQSDIQADLLDLHARGTPSPEIEKVADWRHRSSVQLSELASPPSIPRSATSLGLYRQASRQSGLISGEAVVLQKTAAALPTQPKKKAHDWLAY